MKKLKGFTLVECIVAMALIGITSLLMVQVYGTVAVINRDNNMMNNSIERQMKYAEEQLTKQAALDAQKSGGSLAADSGKVKVIHITNHGNSGDKNNKVNDADKADVKDNNLKMEFKFDDDKMDSSLKNKLKVDVDDIDPEIDLYVIGMEVDSDATVEYGSGAGAEGYDDNNVRYKFIIPTEAESIK